MISKLKMWEFLWWVVMIPIMPFCIILLPAAFLIVIIEHKIHDEIDKRR